MPGHALSERRQVAALQTGPSVLSLTRQSKPRFFRLRVPGHALSKRRRVAALQTGLRPLSVHALWSLGPLVPWSASGGKCTMKCVTHVLPPWRALSTWPQSGVATAPTTRRGGPRSACPSGRRSTSHVQKALSSPQQPLPTLTRSTYSDTLTRPAYTISPSWTTRYWGYPHSPQKGLNSNGSLSSFGELRRAHRRCKGNEATADRPIWGVNNG